MTPEADRHDDDPDAHGPTALLVRRTLAAVADRTVVADRPIQDLGPLPPAAPDTGAAVPPDPSAGSVPAPGGRRPWLVAAAAAAVVLAVVLGDLTLRRNDVVTETATGSATTASVAAVPSGPGAWLLPP